MDEGAGRASSLFLPRFLKPDFLRRPKPGRLAGLLGADV